MDIVWTRSVKHGKVIFAALCFLLLFYLAERQIGNIMHHQKAKKRIVRIEAQNENQVFPVRLRIPSINVDAAIEFVGMTSKGAMGVPNSTSDVGWFDLGPRPGDRGSAVIAGHFDGENGEEGVFTNLSKLKEGDKLYVEEGKGTIIAFVVRESRTYEPGYADEVFNQTDSAHLNLITCDGVWNKAKKSYSKRLVVFADITY